LERFGVFACMPFDEGVNVCLHVPDGPTELAVGWTGLLLSPVAKGRGRHTQLTGCFSFSQGAGF
jgi:hypothetical protein